MATLRFDGCQMEADEVLSHSGVCHHGLEDGGGGGRRGVSVCVR